jgi:DNA mismatch repair protein MLH1
VEDLFYNLQTRKQAFKNANEQYQRVLDVVTKYSIHFGDQKVSFTCKKQGQTMPDHHTPVSSSTLENIKIAYGASLSRELQPFELSHGNIAAASAPVISTSSTRRADETALGALGENDAGLSFSMKGLISNANYSSKKGICIFFINNRLVECQSIKKVIDSVYSEILPRHAHPFLYLSIRMPPQHVDVNVHPVSRLKSFY